MNELMLTKQIVIEDHGQLWTTSLIVAEEFDKEHYNVLKAINALGCSKQFTDVNFDVTEYRDMAGRVQPMYRMTRDGFMFLAMGFTGEKAAQLKERFIRAFNDLSKPQSMLEIMAMSVRALQEQERRTNENTRQIVAVRTEMATFETATEAKIQAIETKLIVDKINQFPDGCETLRWITENHFFGMNPAKVSLWLRTASHPCIEYKYTDNEGKLHSVPVYRKEGIEETKARLVRESQFKKDTPINSIYVNPVIGRFYIKRISHKQNFMNEIDGDLQ